MINVDKQLRMLEAMTGEVDEEVLSTSLSIAGSKILRRA